MAQVSGNIERFTYTPGQSHPRSYLALVIPLDSSQGVSQSGRSAMVGDKEMVLLDLRHPFQCQGLPATSNQLVLFFDASYAETSIPCAEEYTALRIQTQTGWAARLVSYLKGLIPRLLSQHSDDEGQRDPIFAGHILALLHNTLQELRQTPPLGLHSGDDGPAEERYDLQLRRKVIQWLHENFQDSSLSQVKVAKLFGVSVNLLHRAFSANDNRLSFLTMLHKIRAENAARILTDKSNHGLRVAEVGALCGMPSASTFHRVFLDAFGLTPREYRRKFGAD